MPTYEYECKSCLRNFEIFQSMSEPPVKCCPECGNEVRRLIFGGAGVIFKGSGFYVTDKNKSGKSPSAKKSGDKTSPCSGCPSGAETGKCPAAGSSESKAGEGSPAKVNTESKSA